MSETSTPLPPPPPLHPNPQPDNPNPQPESTPTTTAPQHQLTPPPPQQPPQQQQSIPLNPNPTIPQLVPHPNPNPNPNQFTHLPPPPPLGSSPSFRPAGAPIQPNFTPIPPNPNLTQASYPTPPPGVGGPPQIYPGQVPGSNPGVRPPPFATLPNGGFLGHPLPQGSVPPPGVIRYPYPPIVRPPFITRPPVAVGTIPPQPRPPFLAVRPTPQIIRPPVLPIIIPAEKPQTTVYVGKIASSVENEFIRSLLELCGPIKSWKRAQDPSDGTPKRFGFCEFESAEGVLRALRLLTKCSVDGEELVLNVNQATRDYLERYVKKKKENLNKPSEIGPDEAKKEEQQDVTQVQNGEGDKNNNEALKPTTIDEPKKDENETETKETEMSVFGLVNDEDRDADREAQDKISNMIEERIKNKPLPPPPPPPPTMVDSVNDSNIEVPAKSGDKESGVDVKNEEKNDDETLETKPASRAGTESPDRGRRNENRGRDRERERDKRDKERELDRLERERERERARRERERELEIQRAERFYKERVKEWEGREKDKEYKRKQERDKEKEKERERRKLISDQEYESDDDNSKKRRRKNDVEEKRRRRRREKEEDMVDRVKEEEEIAEAKKRAEDEEEREREREIAASVVVANGVESSVLVVESSEMKDDVDMVKDSDLVPENHSDDGVLENGNNDDTTTVSGPTTTVKPGDNAQGKKLGFGLVGSGKRAAVPSVFNEEEDDDAHKEKKLRPLVPIDYSTEENHTSHTTDTSAAVPNSSAYADSGKAVLKEVKSEGERERGRRERDRSSHRERDRDGNDGRTRDGNAILDAKQLIDMIPKTKDDLFSYEINWPVYDENRLHERMRPWISKKITEFLGEEETTLVEFIVDKFREHVKAETMLDILQQVLDEEAEMFVLKMWRMLIFEIKRVETGLAPRPGA